jgi:hypothetical protein
MKKIKGICFLCCNERQLTHEHIIPQALGGKLSAQIYCKGCNDKLGASVDGELIRELGHFGTALNIKRERGENKPYNVESVSNGTELVFDGKEFKRRNLIVKIEKNGDKIKSIDVRARSKKELQNKIAEIKKKYKIDGEVKILYENHPGPTDTKKDLVIDNSLIRRAVSKIAYGLISIKLPSARVLSSSFDDIRSYIRFGSEKDLATANFAHTDFMTDYTRPLHKIHVSLNRRRNLVIGFVCIFGTYRYTVLLSKDYKSSFDWPGLDYTFDPITSKEIFGNPNFRAPELEINEVLSPKQSKQLVLGELAIGHKILESYRDDHQFLKIEAED